MNFEHFERGYLLPKGCKNLIDVINIRGKLQAMAFPRPASGPPDQLPQMKGDLLVPEHATVRELAALLGKAPGKIIADAMQLGVFATVNQSLRFATISQIASKYGYTAKKTA